MTPRPIAANRFTRVSASTAEAVRELSVRRHLLEETREILVSPFGRIVIRCVDVGAPSKHRQDFEAWGIVRARGSEPPGTLVMESLAALRLSNTALGLRAPRVGRILGQTERGVVAAILAAVLRQFSDELALSLRRPGHVRDDLARITLALEAGRYREHVHLHLPPTWLPVSRRRDITTEAVQRRLEVTFRVLIACTDLGADEWSAAETGDAVLFEGTSFPDPFEPWLVHLTCGTHQAEARLSIDGTLSIASEFEIHGTPHRSCGQPGKDPMSTSAESRASRAEALLASAPVEIVAEIGRITLPAAEVLALGPGSVLPLGWIRPESVDLRVGDRSWARGELVDLDGQLAVRLTSVASAPTPANTPPGDTQPIR